MPITYPAENLRQVLIFLDVGERLRLCLCIFCRVVNLVPLLFQHLKNLTQTNLYHFDIPFITILGHPLSVFS